MGYLIPTRSAPTPQDVPDDTGLEHNRKTAWRKGVEGLVDSNGPCLVQAFHLRRIQEELQAQLDKQLTEVFCPSKHREPPPRHGLPCSPSLLKHGGDCSSRARKSRERGVGEEEDFVEGVEYCNAEKKRSNLSTASLFEEMERPWREERTPEMKRDRSLVVHEAHRHSVWTSPDVYDSHLYHGEVRKQHESHPDHETKRQREEEEEMNLYMRHPHHRHGMITGKESMDHSQEEQHSAKKKEEQKRGLQHSQQSSSTSAYPTLHPYPSYYRDRRDVPQQIGTSLQPSEYRGSPCQRATPQSIVGNNRSSSLSSSTQERKGDAQERTKKKEDRMQGKGEHAFVDSASYRASSHSRQNPHSPPCASFPLPSSCHCSWCSFSSSCSSSVELSSSSSCPKSSPLLHHSDHSHTRHDVSDPTEVDKASTRRCCSSSPPLPSFLPCISSLSSSSFSPSCNACSTRLPNKRMPSQKLRVSCPLSPSQGCHPVFVRGSGVHTPHQLAESSLSPPCIEEEKENQSQKANASGYHTSSETPRAARAVYTPQKYIFIRPHGCSLSNSAGSQVLFGRSSAKVDGAKAGRRREIESSWLRHLHSLASTDRTVDRDKKTDAAKKRFDRRSTASPGMSLGSKAGEKNQEEEGLVGCLQEIYEMLEREGIDYKEANTFVAGELSQITRLMQRRALGIRQRELHARRMIEELKIHQAISANQLHRLAQTLLSEAVTEVTRSVSSSFSLVSSPSTDKRPRGRYIVSAEEQRRLLVLSQQVAETIFKSPVRSEVFHSPSFFSPSHYKKGESNSSSSTWKSNFQPCPRPPPVVSEGEGYMTSSQDGRSLRSSSLPHLRQRPSSTPSSNHTQGLHEEEKRLLLYYLLRSLTSSSPAIERNLVMNYIARLVFSSSPQGWMANEGEGGRNTEEEDTTRKNEITRYSSEKNFSLPSNTVTTVHSHQSGYPKSSPAVSRYAPYRPPMQSHPSRFPQKISSCSPPSSSSSSSPISSDVHARPVVRKMASARKDPDRHSEAYRRDICRSLPLSRRPRGSNFSPKIEIYFKQRKETSETNVKNARQTETHAPCDACTADKKNNKQVYEEDKTKKTEKSEEEERPEDKREECWRAKQVDYSRDEGNGVNPREMRREDREEKDRQDLCIDQRGERLRNRERQVGNEGALLRRSLKEEERGISVRERRNERGDVVRDVRRWKLPSHASRTHSSDGNGCVERKDNRSYHYPLDKTELRSEEKKNQERRNLRVNEEGPPTFSSPVLGSHSSSFDERILIQKELRDSLTSPCLPSRDFDEEESTNRISTRTLIDGGRKRSLFSVGYRKDSFEKSEAVKEGKAQSLLTRDCSTEPCWAYEGKEGEKAGKEDRKGDTGRIGSFSSRVKTSEELQDRILCPYSSSEVFTQLSGGSDKRGERTTGISSVHRSIGPQRRAECLIDENNGEVSYQRKDEGKKQYRYPLHEREPHAAWGGMLRSESADDAVLVDQPSRYLFLNRSPRAVFQGKEGEERRLSQSMVLRGGDERNREQGRRQATPFSLQKRGSNGGQREEEREERKEREEHKKEQEVRRYMSRSGDRYNRCIRGNEPRNEASEVLPRRSTSRMKIERSGDTSGFGGLCVYRDTGEVVSRDEVDARRVREGGREVRGDRTRDAGEVVEKTVEERVQGRKYLDSSYDRENINQLRALQVACENIRKNSSKIPSGYHPGENVEDTEERSVAREKKKQEMIARMLMRIRPVAMACNEGKAQAERGMFDRDSSERKNPLLVLATHRYGSCWSSGEVRSISEPGSLSGAVRTPQDLHRRGASFQQQVPSIQHKGIGEVGVDIARSSHGVIQESDTRKKKAQMEGKGRRELCNDDNDSDDDELFHQKSAIWALSVRPRQLDDGSGRFSDTNREKANRMAEKKDHYKSGVSAFVSVHSQDLSRTNERFEQGGEFLPKRNVPQVFAPPSPELTGRVEEAIRRLKETRIVPSPSDLTAKA
ncbi:hypothetical protein CSUI_007547 [Cystoisospora suis]|uniref:Uncharacterized protein n=1 Tax=Cystoisospora suis TaxID=483139 RepID=A0A2C6KPT7_9APIC|nr:hypothetical protein CSUI_007547 [Cystoisospora suis]